MNEFETVKAMLEARRVQLVRTGTLLGLTHPKTLKLSRKVDELHNELNRIVRNQSHRTLLDNQGE